MPKLSVQFDIHGKDDGILALVTILEQEERNFIERPYGNIVLSSNYYPEFDLQEDIWFVRGKWKELDNLPIVVADDKLIKEMMIATMLYNWGLDEYNAYDADIYVDKEDRKAMYDKAEKLVSSINWKEHDMMVVVSNGIYVM